jgi:alpha-ribazole phosphatase/probable phosphoglycerate mutase
MKGLVFIRHAETDLAGTFCGHSDPPVNSKGQIQITEMISRLGSEPFDAIHSSDLRRAMETAAPLAHAFALPVVTSGRLREIHFGDWESLSWAEVEQRDAIYARRWMEAFPALAAPNGESFASFEQRVLEEVHHLRSLAENKRIAVVTHGGVMRVVLRMLLGYSEEQAWDLTRKLYCSSFVCSGAIAASEVRP